MKYSAYTMYYYPTEEIKQRDATIAELLEALEQISNVMSGDGLSKAQLHNQLDFAKRTAIEAIRKARSE